MATLRSQLDGSLCGKVCEEAGKSYTVRAADDFSYTDPIDGAVAQKQVRRWCVSYSLKLNNKTIL